MTPKKLLIGIVLLFFNLNCLAKTYSSDITYKNFGAEAKSNKLKNSKIKGEGCKLFPILVHDNSRILHMKYVKDYLYQKLESVGYRITNSPNDADFVINWLEEIRGSYAKSFSKRASIDNDTYADRFNSTSLSEIRRFHHHIQSLGNKYKNKRLEMNYFLNISSCHYYSDRSKFTQDALYGIQAQTHILSDQYFLSNDEVYALVKMIDQFVKNMGSCTNLKTKIRDIEFLGSQSGSYVYGPLRSCGDLVRKTREIYRYNY